MNHKGKYCFIWGKNKNDSRQCVVGEKENSVLIKERAEIDPELPYMSRAEQDIEV